MANYLWHKSYPPGVPPEIDVTKYRSLVQILEEAYAAHGSRTAAICMGARISYKQVDETSKQIAAWLQSKGLKRGARVAVMMPNILQYFVCTPAILRAGYTVVNVNPLYTPRELQHQLKDSGAEAIFVLENFAVTLQEVLANTPVKHVVVASMGDMLGFLKGQLVNFVVRAVKKMVPPYELPGAIRFNKMLDEAERMQFKPVDVGPDDIAFLQYTGGTTGVSKGATLLHRNVVANVLQNEAWIGKHLVEGSDPNEERICVTALPLYHIFALTACYMMGARLGNTALLIPNPRDIPGFVKTLQGYKVAMFPGLNTLFNALNNNPDFAKLDFSKLRVTLGGGMATNRATALRWQEITGSVVGEGYGLSETSPGVTVTPPNGTEFTGTIGMPLPNTIVSLRDDDGNEVPLGERGEICIKGPQVMAGYWQRPEETAKVMSPDGYFKSGDVGVMEPNGYIRIVDRKKDMILVSGFNVYPNEIEEVASACPGVLECAAIGVPDKNSGEAVKLFIIKKDQALTERDVADYCAKNLTGYKKPKYIEFRTELPKTNVGKILRRELRDAEMKKAA
ncbi:MAG: long-chain-fatty-acid--CoA ligase [Burkholderiaceae bacterium]